MDSIAQMITTIKNAGMIGRKEIEVPFSKFKKAILDIIKSEGYLSEVKIDDKIIKITLSYKGKAWLINDIKRVSKPGRHLYRKAGKIPFYKRGMGIYVVSTSAGVMTDKQARQKGVGGELICQIY